jgi:hypothetical protein
MKTVRLPAYDKRVSALARHFAPKLMNGSKIISFALIIIFASALMCRAEDKAVGRWEGVVQVPDWELRLTIDLEKDEGGSWRGSVTIPNLNVKGALLVDIDAKDSAASFGMKAGRGLEATFRGRFSADGTFSGDFTQAGNQAPFILKKIGPPQVETPPRSTPIAKELEGEWKGEYQMLGASRQVTLKLANNDQNSATAELVIVGRKVNNLPVDLVTQEGELITIDSHQTGISYEGRLDKNANQIKGTFIQGPIELPLLLHRSK